jgi:hypothetical protein
MRKSLELIFGFCIEALIQSTLSSCLVSKGSKHTTLTRSIATWFNVDELVRTGVSIIFLLTVWIILPKAPAKVVQFRWSRE